MKRIIIPLLLLFSIGTFGQAGWVDQTPFTDLPGLYGVFSLDGLDVWVVGDEGTILHSLDGGDSWTLIEGVTDQTIYTVEFISADVGFLGCDNDWNDSFLYKTVDGGITWVNVADVLYSPFQGQEVRDIDFVEVEGTGNMRGYASGGLSFAWLTEDLGDTWASINGACGMGSFESCCIVDENMGWFVGLASTMNDATVTLMTDAGGTWTPQLNPTEQPLRGVCFANDVQGVAVGLVGTIINTADGGETWVSQDNDGYRWEGVFMTGTGKARCCPMWTAS